MPDVRVELPSPLGGVELLVEPRLGVRVQLPSPLGGVSLTVDTQTSARMVLPSVLDGVLLRVAPIPAARIEFPSPLGGVRLTVSPQQDDWAEAGLPCITPGYDYSADDGLVRTEMASGYVRQRARWKNLGYRETTLSCVLNQEDLYALEVFLNAKGYDWFGVVLETEDSPTATGSLHYARVVGDPKLSNVEGDMISVELPVNIQRA